MIAACLKWVDHKPDVDPLTGEVRTDWRTSGASDADRAALEWALRLGERWGQPVVAVTAGPAVADALLHDALAAGAAAGVRADIPLDTPSATVAAALAAALPSPPALVMCGVWSLDRGSGAVPAFLAAELGAVQALGLISLAASDDDPPGLVAERRLDRGARERIRVALPAVCSVEGGSARLRRASLPRLLEGERASITVSSPGGRGLRPDAVRSRPYRPRAKELAPPEGRSARERILALTGALTDREPPRTVVLDPAAAAEELLARLRAWGYLP